MFNNNLKQLYIKLNKLMLSIRLSHEVEDKPINLHYMRSIKKCITDIKIGHKDENRLIEIAEKLLVVKAPEVENTTQNVDNYSDLEGAAEEVVVNNKHENEKNHTIHENVKPHLKTQKGAQKGVKGNYKPSRTPGARGDK